MKVKVFINNPWQQNTVLLYDETGEAVVVDCGCFAKDEEENLKAFLSENRLKPVALLDTHLHIDHIFGNGFIQETYGLKAQASQADEFLIEHAIEYAALLGISGITQPPRLGGYLKDGDTVEFGHSKLSVIAVPGHSPGGLCFYSEADRLLIAGDVLFAGSVGRSDFPGGDSQLLLDGIRDKLFVLPDEVKVIPGHGPATTIGEEKKYNPFFSR